MKNSSDIIVSNSFKTSPTFSQVYGLETGDKIVEPLFQTGLSKHYAIYIGIDNEGVEWIAENHKFKNVRIIPAVKYFSERKKIDRIDKFRGSLSERQTIISNAYKLEGKEYNLVNYNCEHFVNEVLIGKVVSQQVNNVLAGIFTVLIIGLITMD